MAQVMAAKKAAFDVAELIEFNVKTLMSTLFKRKIVEIAKGLENAMIETIQKFREKKLVVKGLIGNASAVYLTEKDINYIIIQEEIKRKQLEGTDKNLEIEGGRKTYKRKNNKKKRLRKTQKGGFLPLAMGIMQGLGENKVNNLAGQFMPGNSFDGNSFDGNSFDGNNIGDNKDMANQYMNIQKTAIGDEMKGIAAQKLDKLSQRYIDPGKRMEFQNNSKTMNMYGGNEQQIENLSNFMSKDCMSALKTDAKNALQKTEEFRRELYDDLVTYPPEWLKQFQEKIQELGDELIGAEKLAMITKILDCVVGKVFEQLLADKLKDHLQVIFLDGNFNKELQTTVNNALKTREMETIYYAVYQNKTEDNTKCKNKSLEEIINPPSK
jgi:hypothetical protein